TALPAANGTSFAPGEPIFIEATITFRRVDLDGDGIPDPYYAIRPDAHNVYFTVQLNGSPVYMNRILEAPALDFPGGLLLIPGGTDPCPPGSTQRASDQACQVSAVIDITQGFTGLGGGTLTATPTYFSFNQDPERNANGTCGLN